jgi:exopolyphosphatase/guanosine-5'-triphosphate,3'-diphosphate pyrophosphatase
MHIMEHQEDAVAARLAPVRAVAEEVDLEPEHPFHVCALARALFLETQTMHGLSDDARALLEAAALLHDIGLREGANGHHKRSRDWILTQGVPGFGPRERDIIACIARYHRKSHPKPGHAVYRDLSPEDQGLVQMLAGILRVADGLDRTHTAASRGIRVCAEGPALRLYVAQERASETDIWGGMRKRFLLEDVLGSRIEMVPEVIAGINS